MKIKLLVAAVFFVLCGVRVPAQTYNLQDLWVRNGVHHAFTLISKSVDSLLLHMGPFIKAVDDGGEVIYVCPDDSTVLITFEENGYQQIQSVAVNAPARYKQTFELMMAEQGLQRQYVSEKSGYEMYRNKLFTLYWKKAEPGEGIILAILKNGFQ